MDAPDPNAYATGAQAASVNARAAFEEHDVDHARKRREFAAEALLAAKQRLQELDAAYKLGQKAFDEAEQYDQLAAQQLEASLARLAEVRAPLHPVRKTPLELLGLIFEYCWDPLPTYSLLSEKPVDVRRRQRQPFQLAAVCRRWRQASLSCPMAWNCIELRLDGIMKAYTKYWAAYLSCILDRSASTPLHLRIIRSRCDQTWDKNLIPRLAAEMHRCESLLLSAGRVRNNLDNVVSLVTTQTPALRALHLMLRPEEDALNLPSILPHAPILTRVQTSLRFARDQSPLPAVTFIALHEPVITDVGDYLGTAMSVFPNVEEVSLIEPTATPNQTTPEKVVCNNSRLHIRPRSTTANGIAFADRFVFPRLDYLYVYGSDKDSAARVHFVHSLLPEAAPLLTELVFVNLAERDIEAFVQGLRTASRLSKLRLAGCQIGPHGLRQICHAFGRVSDDGSWLCPTLTVLSLYNCTFLESCSMENLVELVERRNHAASGTDQPQRPQRLTRLSLPAGVDRTITSRISALL